MSVCPVCPILTIAHIPKITLNKIGQEYLILSAVISNSYYPTGSGRFIVRRKCAKIKIPACVENSALIGRLRISDLSNGSYHIRAVYCGDDNNGMSKSKTSTFRVKD